MSNAALVGSFRKSGSGLKGYISQVRDPRLF